jgi:hypothetical protein
MECVLGEGGEKVVVVVVVVVHGRWHMCDGDADRNNFDLMA